jgi:hypothetical protein
MFIYANKRNWFKYLLPVWMNAITWKESEEPTSKIYRWLIFGWTVLD